jgi:hypothetical protein
LVFGRAEFEQEGVTGRSLAFQFSQAGPAAAEGSGMNGTKLRAFWDDFRVWEPGRFPGLPGSVSG